MDLPAASAAESRFSSADGRYVAFDCWASNMGAGDIADEDVFVRDLLAGTTELVNVTFSNQDATQSFPGQRDVWEYPARTGAMARDGTLKMTRPRCGHARKSCV